MLAYIISCSAEWQWDAVVAVAISLYWPAAIPDAQLELSCLCLDLGLLLYVFSMLVKAPWIAWGMVYVDTDRQTHCCVIAAVGQIPSANIGLSSCVSGTNVPEWVSVFPASGTLLWPYMSLSFKPCVSPCVIFTWLFHVEHWQTPCHLSQQAWWVCVTSVGVCLMQLQDWKNRGREWLPWK